MGVSVGGRDDDGGIGREVVLGGLASLIASRPAFAGDGEAACKNDQTPDATKPALGGFCFASYLVEPGGFEPPSASTPLSVLHA
jgi:hypothetical protein